MNYYTYLYRDPKDGTPRYVGKGQEKRAWSHLKKADNLKFGQMIEERTREGYTVEPIINYEVDEDTALNMEMFWIAFYGREDLGTGTLFNLTDGGEGVRGALITEEQRKRMSESRKGEGNAMYGRNHTDEAKAAVSVANRGRKASFETLQKLSEATGGEKNGMYGKKHSDEAKRRISEANKGRKRPESANLAATEKLKGKKSADSVTKRKETYAARTQEEWNKIIEKRRETREHNRIVRMMEALL